MSDKEGLTDHSSALRIPLVGKDGTDRRYFVSRRVFRGNLLKS